MNPESIIRLFRDISSECFPLFEIEISSLKNSPGYTLSIYKDSFEHDITYFLDINLDVFPYRDSRQSRSPFFYVRTHVEVGEKDTKTWDILNSFRTFELYSVSQIPYIINQTCSDLIRLIGEVPFYKDLSPYKDIQASSIYKVISRWRRKEKNS